jgi:hypothetical protein
MVPEISVRIERGYRSHAVPLAVKVVNATSRMIMGYVHHRGNPIMLHPMVEGATATVEIPSHTLEGEKVHLRFEVRSPARPPWSLKEELTVDGYAFGAYRIEIGDKGCKVFPGIRFAWKPGSPAIRPVVLVHDKKKGVHELHWGPIKDGEPGGPRDCFVEGAVAKVQVVGAYSFGEEQHLIGGDGDGLTLTPDEPAGLYHLTRAI